MEVRILSEREEDLGMPLMSKVTWTKGRRKRHATKETNRARAAFEPFVQEIEERATILGRPQGSVWTRVVDWQTYSVGVLLYPAAQFTPPSDTVKKIRRAQSAIIGARNLIKADGAGDVYYALNLTTAVHIMDALDVAIITAAMRQYGRGSFGHSECQKATMAHGKYWKKIEIKDKLDDLVNLAPSLG